MIFRGSFRSISVPSVSGKKMGSEDGSKGPATNGWKPRTLRGFRPLTIFRETSPQRCHTPHTLSFDHQTGTAEGQPGDLRVSGRRLRDWDTGRAYPRGAGTSGAVSVMERVGERYTAYGCSAVAVPFFFIDSSKILDSRRVSKKKSPFF